MIGEKIHIRGKKKNLFHDSQHLGVSEWLSSVVLWGIVWDFLYDTLELTKKKWIGGWGEGVTEW